ncbi:YqaJ viral recombinase family protein [Solimonas marina]|uniref:YqaJ viral recombinase domain-containing protein n=1 Tax=Solimonas marina TaxID=2714601 RepID=A0A969W6L7_9GAMM|nr:YqaJ viral recombinase family protein [Solimonas marina]NKF21542.1 hypothetical protein [Solimonas marina]
MREIHVLQGTPEWRTHRAKTRNASDAPAMMGVSPYVTRAQLIRRQATGVEEEIDAATQKRFDRGHEVEPALRALAETMTGEDLFPVVAISDDGYLGASFDGVSMDEEIIFEGKQANASKIADVQRNVIPAVDYWQIVQQFAICEKATTCVYLVGDGTESGTASLVIERDRVQADIVKLRASWEQFDKDVAAYVPETTTPAVVAAAVTALPAVAVQVDGQIAVRDNFAHFETALRDFIENRLIREPKTDQDFADLDMQIKAMKNAEVALESAETQMLSQIAAIDTAKRTKDMLAKLVRDNRLMAERLLASEKERRRAEAIASAKAKLAEHVNAINKTFGSKIRLPDVEADFAGVIKGRSSLAKINEALETELARTKIEANQAADRIRVNLEVLRNEAAGYETLFMDAQSLVTTKGEEDLRNLVKARIGEHQAKEQKRLDEERERIRREEAASAAAQLEADRKRIAEEAERKAREEAAARLAEVEKSIPREPAPISTLGAVNDPPAAETARAPAVTDAPAPAPHGAAHQQAGGARKPAGARIKLGDINARIAPLSISAEGLASLGFEPVATEKNAKLYAESDFVSICNVLSARLQRAAAMQEAA